MNTYEIPTIIELGSVTNLTRGNGTEFWFDSEYRVPARGFLEVDGDFPWNNVS